MKGLLKGVAALALVAAVGASSAQAQGVNFGVAGTGLFSLESGGTSRFGVTGLVGFGGSATSPIGFRVDGTFFPKKDGSTSVLATGDIVYTFATAASSMFHPYLLAGGGIIHSSYSNEGGSFTKPMAKAGVGADYMMGSVMLFGEATFDMFFYGNSGTTSGKSGTDKNLQANLGVKFGGK